MRDQEKPSCGERISSGLATIFYLIPLQNRNPAIQALDAKWKAGEV